MQIPRKTALLQQKKSPGYPEYLAESPAEVKAINAEVRAITEEFQAPTGRYRELVR